MGRLRMTGVQDTTRDSKKYWDERFEKRWDESFHGMYLDGRESIDLMDSVNYEVISGLLKRIQGRKKDGEKTRILEAACGVGRYAPILFVGVDEYIGIDFGQLAIEEAKRWYERPGNGIKFFEADMQAFTYPEKFDLIFMTAAMSSVEERSQEIVDHFRTLLAPGGVIAIFEQDQYLVIWRKCE